jgi:hypothetical protein
MKRNSLTQSAEFVNCKMQIKHFMADEILGDRHSAAMGWENGLPILRQITENHRFFYAPDVLS